MENNFYSLPTEKIVIPYNEREVEYEIKENGK
jgi:hypothetical protein